MAVAVVLGSASGIARNTVPTMGSLNKINWTAAVLMFSGRRTCILTTKATVSEATRSMTFFVLCWEISISRIHTPAPHRTAVQNAHNGARTRQGCANVAAGKPKLHAEVAHGGILELAQDYSCDHDDYTQNALLTRNPLFYSVYRYSLALFIGSG